MASSRLRPLHGKSVAVEMFVGREWRLLKGTGRYDATLEGGAGLLISIADAAGDFELLFREAEWNGNVRPGRDLGCDFAIKLEPVPLPAPIEPHATDDPS